MKKSKNLELAEELRREKTGHIRNKKKVDRIIIGVVSIAWALVV